MPTQKATVLTGEFYMKKMNVNNASTSSSTDIVIKVKEDDWVWFLFDFSNFPLLLPLIMLEIIAFFFI